MGYFLPTRRQEANRFFTGRHQNPIAGLLLTPENLRKLETKNEKRQIFQAITTSRMNLTPG
jgi:hypothetical protein